MKKILIPLVLVLSVIAFWSYKKTNSQETNLAKPEKNSLPVSVQTIAESQKLQEKIIYPGTVSGKNEFELRATTGGTIVGLEFDLGESVSAGQILVKIDSVGNSATPGKNNFQSSDILQLEQAVRLAKEALELAENNYKKDNSFSNRSARDSAKRQYENAVLNLSGGLDSRLLVAPTFGTIVSRNVSLGDSVSPGQLLATISQTQKMKVAFFVAAEQFAHFSLKLPLKLIDSSGNEISAKVTAISPVADSATKKFLIEAEPLEKTALLGGTIVNVSVEIEKSPKKSGNLLLPLSAITVGQNESFLFIAENGKAKKTSMKIEDIQGETAEISLPLPLETKIVIAGNKALRDGDAVEIKNE